MVALLRRRSVSDTDGNPLWRLRAFDDVARRSLAKNPGAPRRINITNMCRSLYYPENACGHRRPPLIAASGR